MFTLITTENSSYSFVAAPGSDTGQFAAYTGGAALEGKSFPVFVSSVQEATVGERLHIPGTIRTSVVTAITTLTVSAPTTVAVLDPKVKANEVGALASDEALAALREKLLGGRPAQRMSRARRPGANPFNDAPAKVGTPAYYR